jgi:hypothetical protein
VERPPALSARRRRVAQSSHLDPPLLELDLARVHVARVLQLGDLRLRRHVVVQLRVLPLQRELLLQLLVVALQLLDRPALLREDRLRLPAVRLRVPLHDPVLFLHAVELGLLVTHRALACSTPGGRASLRVAAGFLQGCGRC